jgi:GH18 family chitinase
MKKILLLFATLILINVGSAQLIDAFTYADGQLNGAGNWVSLTNTPDTIIQVYNNQVRVYDANQSWRWQGVYYDSAVTDNATFSFIVSQLSSTTLDFGIISVPHEHGNGNGYWISYIRSGAIDTIRLRIMTSGGLSVLAQTTREMLVNDTLSIVYKNGVVEAIVYNGANSAIVSANDTTHQSNSKFFRLMLGNTTAGAVGYIIDNFSGTIKTTAPTEQIPSVTTQAATSITRTSATLNGSINPNNVSTDAWFRYGLDSLLATYDSTTTTNLGAGGSAVSHSRSLTSLVENTDYYFRAVARNNLGTSLGSILTFKTLPPPNLDLNPPSISNVAVYPATVDTSLFFRFTAIAYDDSALATWILIYDTVEVDSGNISGIQSDIITKYRKDSVAGNKPYQFRITDLKGRVFTSQVYYVNIGLPSELKPLKVVAYYPIWACCDIPPQKIDWRAMTHLIWFSSEPSYTFPYMRELVNSVSGQSDSAIIETGGSDLTGTWLGWCYNSLSNNNTNGITHLSIARDSAYANNVKLILCAGGEVGTNATIFNWIIADTTRQDVYINHTFEYLKRKGFQGIDLNIEYPISGQKALTERFMLKWREKLNTMNPPGWLSFTAPAWYSDWVNRFSPAVANATLDGFLLMGYGMGASNYSGFNAPLARPSVVTYPNYNAWTLDNYGPGQMKQAGYDSSIIVMLIAFETAEWTGVDGPGQTRISNPSFGNYSNVLTKKVQFPSSYRWDNDSKVPWLGFTEGGAKRFISYEDSASIDEKVKFAREHGIGGVGVWELYRGWLPAIQQDPLLQYLKTAVGATSSIPSDFPNIPNLSAPNDGVVLETFPSSLSWYTTPKATEYHVQLDTVNTFNSAFLKSAITSNLSVNTNTWAGLAHYLEYYWRVQGINAVGSSAWSEIRSFTLQEVSIPNAPTLLTPINGAVDQSVNPTLVWNKISNATEYNYWVSKDSIFTTDSLVSSGQVTDTFVVLISARIIPAVAGGGLDGDRTYYWRVQAENNLGASDFSDTSHFTTASILPFDYQTDMYFVKEGNVWKSVLGILELTTAQRDSSSLGNGSKIYNKDSGKLNFKENGVWVEK